MRGEIFTEQVAGYEFAFEKLMLKNGEILFFVTSNMPGERSFFMSRINGKWQILYHHILGKTLLLAEPELAEAIIRRGF
ncbi:hypothetical protein CAP35_03915 [Chitinophagaceae bacterium IBVUCB1]|jgi:hypothetical protein|nr:hypothetical protein CAP35_03915 [Chitinophagaceae bacterium IBVUCB1]